MAKKQQSLLPLNYYLNNYNHYYHQKQFQQNQFPIKFPQFPPNNNKIKPINSGFKIPENIIDDLCSRFIINIPNEEQDNLIRICFQIELAHWFYLDFNCSENSSLPKCSFHEFARIIFNHIPFLNSHLFQLETIIGNWKEYKSSVPTYGAILLDESMESVLMVQGYWTKTGWGFPKGKINENESPMNCACREVREETGYNCESKISENDYIEVKIRETFVRLYIVKGVDKNQTFKPITRNEIRSIQWFKIIDLPQSKRDMTFKQNLNLNANCFFMAIPFIKPLKKWITNEKRKKFEMSYSKFGNSTFDKSMNKSHKFENKFWASCWNNIRLDWDQIWKDIEIN